MISEGIPTTRAATTPGASHLPGTCRAAVHEPTAYLAREAARVPVVAVRGADGVVRAFRNVCRHRGATCTRARSFRCSSTISIPDQIIMAVLDPTAVDRTTVTSYAWRDNAGDLRVASELVDQGAAEDFAVARSIQKGLAGEANQSLLPRRRAPDESATRQARPGSPTPRTAPAARTS